MEIKEKEDGGMRVKTNVMLGLGAVILIVIAAVAAFRFGLTRGADSEPAITSDLLEQRLCSVQELVSVTYYYTNMAKYEDQKDFFGWSLPFTSKSFIVSYDGVIKAGIDLSAVEVAVNEDKKTVTVKLPESQIMSHEIKEDSLTVFDESDNVFNHITIEDYNGFTVAQKAEREDYVIENGLLEEAAKKAQEAIDPLLRLTPGMEEYTLTFTDK